MKCRNKHISGSPHRVLLFPILSSLDQMLSPTQTAFKLLAVIMTTPGLLLYSVVLITITRTGTSHKQVSVVTDKALWLPEKNMVYSPATRSAGVLPRNHSGKARLC